MTDHAIKRMRDEAKWDDRQDVVLLCNRALDGDDEARRGLSFAAWEACARLGHDRVAPAGDDDHVICRRCEQKLPIRE